MRILVTFLLLISVICRENPAAAQIAGGEKEQFSWKLSGRVFFDGGVINRDSTVTAFQVNDIRIGANVRFLEHWEGKIELGYGDSKISFKDIYLNYTLGDHMFRLGFYYEPFGNARVGTANFRFMTNAMADKILGDKRKMGFTYAYNRKWVNVMAGVFSDGDIEKSKPLNQGYILAAKWVGRPFMQDKKLVHIGVAPRFCSNASEISFSGGTPTDLLSKKENTILDARVEQVINQWKLDLEVILLYNKWYMQGQYFLSHLNRFAAPDYNAKGSYIQAGYMIIGEKHNYNSVTGMVVNPDRGSLEVLVRYNNVNLNDAGIQGGRMSDISLGMNYFVNKFVAAKVNYTRMMPGNTALGGKNDFDVIQARLQFSF